MPSNQKTPVSLTAHHKSIKIPTIIRYFTELNLSIRREGIFMKINHVHAVYFSPTGNAKRLLLRWRRRSLTHSASPMDSYDFTLPESREKVHTYGANDLLVIGTRFCRDASQKMLPFVRTHFEEWRARHSGGCLRNRNFDNGLIELRNELEAHGFHPSQVPVSRPSTYSATSWQPDVQMRMISHRSTRSASRRLKRSLL